ncbi:orotidine-5'-phosphate decarboxylase [Patescibacteria group bacterium]
MLPNFKNVLDRVVFAMDPKSPTTPLTTEEITNYAKILGGKVGTFKMNSVFYGKNRDFALKTIIDSGSSLWIDCKVHDIPETVLAECVEMVELVNNLDGDLRFITVHTSGTGEMLKYAVDGLDEKYGEARPLILGITILTSIGQDAFNKELCIFGSIQEHVVHLAKIAQNVGADGIVCSPKEALAVNKVTRQDLLRVTPGIRFSDQSKDHQKRVTTPADAIKVADMLVMGSALKKGNPAENIARVKKEIEIGLQDQT